MKWVIQDTCFEENEENLCKEVVRQGHELYKVKYTPFIEKQDVPDVDGSCLFYGSLGMAAKLKRQTNWLIFCNLNKMKCAYYYPKYGKYLLNDPYELVCFGEIDRIRERLFDRFGPHDIFVRPDSGFKTFTGSLLGREESLKHFLVNSVVFPEELCIVSSRKQILREWRLVACGGEIIASSQYHDLGLKETQEGCPTEVLKLGQEILDHYSIDDIFTIDIGQTKDRLGLVEINSFSCSGLYDCNLKNIVYYVSKECKRIYEESL